MLSDEDLSRRFPPQGRGGAPRARRAALAGLLAAREGGPRDPALAEDAAQQALIRLVEAAKGAPRARPGRRVAAVGRAQRGEEHGARPGAASATRSEERAASERTHGPDRRDPGLRRRPPRQGALAARPPLRARLHAQGGRGDARRPVDHRVHVDQGRRREAESGARRRGDARRGRGGAPPARREDPRPSEREGAPRGREEAAPPRAREARGRAHCTAGRGRPLARGARAGSSAAARARRARADLAGRRCRRYVEHADERAPSGRARPGSRRSCVGERRRDGPRSEGSRGRLQARGQGGPGSGGRDREGRTPRLGAGWH